MFLYPSTSKILYSSSRPSFPILNHVLVFYPSSRPCFTIPNQVPVFLSFITSMFPSFNHVHVSLSFITSMLHYPSSCRFFSFLLFLYLSSRPCFSVLPRPRFYILHHVLVSLSFMKSIFQELLRWFQLKVWWNMKICWICWSVENVVSCVLHL